MIQILLLANESLLSDHIASTLSEENDLKVVRLNRLDSVEWMNYSLAIIIDEGEIESELISPIEGMKGSTPVLLIKMSLQSRNILVYEKYQLMNPDMERIVGLIRDFSTAYLMKNSSADLARLKKMKSATSTIIAQIPEPASQLFARSTFQYLGRSNPVIVTQSMNSERLHQPQSLFTNPILSSTYKRR